MLAYFRKLKRRRFIFMCGVVFYYRRFTKNIFRILFYKLLFILPMFLFLFCSVLICSVLFCSVLFCFCLFFLFFVFVLLYLRFYMNRLLWYCYFWLVFYRKHHILHKDAARYRQIKIKNRVYSCYKVLHNIHLMFGMCFLCKEDNPTSIYMRRVITAITLPGWLKSVRLIHGTSRHLPSSGDTARIQYSIA